VLRAVVQNPSISNGAKDARVYDIIALRRPNITSLPTVSITRVEEVETGIAEQESVDVVETWAED
jgi:hypothetical protein